METGGWQGTFVSIGGNWRVTDWDISFCLWGREGYRDISLCQWKLGGNGIFLSVIGDWRVAGYIYLSVRTGGRRGTLSLSVRTEGWQGKCPSDSGDWRVTGDMYLLVGTGGCLAQCSLSVRTGDGRGHFSLFGG